MVNESTTKTTPRLAEVVGGQSFSEKRMTLADVAEKDLIIEYAKVLPSDFGGDFVLLECRDGLGEHFSLATSARNIVAAITKVCESNQFPVAAKFVQAKTRKGRKVWTIQ